MAEQANDFFSQLGEFQKKSYVQWGDAYNKLYHPLFDSMNYWQGMKMPFQMPDLFTKWNEKIKEPVGKSADQVNEDLGPQTIDRMMRASNVFVALNEFWMETLKELPELYKVKGDAEKSREIFDMWGERYKSLFEKMLGMPVSNAAEEIMASWLNTIQMDQTALGLVWNPWIEAMPKLQEQAEKITKGDFSAIAEGFSLWRDVYNDTLGRIFRMPAFGLTKEHTERVRKAYAAYIQFASSLPYLYQFFYNTGMTALKEVFHKLQNLKFDELTPETMREIYKIWLTTNENAFFELFKRPDFSNTMGEVFNYGLRFKKRLDDLTAEWCKSLSIPTNRDHDKMATAIHELRRKVRLQQKNIDALQHKLESL